MANQDLDLHIPQSIEGLPEIGVPKPILPFDPESFLPYAQKKIAYEQKVAAGILPPPKDPPIFPWTPRPRDPELVQKHQEMAAKIKELLEEDEGGMQADPFIAERLVKIDQSVIERRRQEILEETKKDNEAYQIRRMKYAPKENEARLFAALPIPEEVLAAIDELRNTELPGVTWCPTEMLKTCLFFLGAVDRSKINDLVQALSQIKIFRFPVSYSKLDLDIRGKHYGSIYLRLRYSKGANILHNKIQQAAEEILGTKTGWGFTSILNIGRLDHPDIVQLKKFIWRKKEAVRAISYKASKFMLIESALSADPNTWATYSCIKSFPLMLYSTYQAYLEKECGIRLKNLHPESKEEEEAELASEKSAEEPRLEAGPSVEGKAETELAQEKGAAKPQTKAATTPKTKRRPRLSFRQKRTQRFFLTTAVRVSGIFQALKRYHYRYLVIKEYLEKLKLDAEKQRIEAQKAADKAQIEAEAKAALAKQLASEPQKSSVRVLSKAPAGPKPEDFKASDLILPLLSLPEGYPLCQFSAEDLIREQHTISVSDEDIEEIYAPGTTVQGKPIIHINAIPMRTSDFYVKELRRLYAVKYVSLPTESMPTKQPKKKKAPSLPAGKVAKAQKSPGKPTPPVSGAKIISKPATSAPKILSKPESGASSGISGHEASSRATRSTPVSAYKPATAARIIRRPGTPASAFPRAGENLAPTQAEEEQIVAVRRKVKVAEPSTETASETVKATVVRRRVKVAEPAAEAAPEAEKATVVRRRVKVAEPAAEAAPEAEKATVVRRRVKAAEPAAEAAPEAEKATVVRRRVKAAEPAAEAAPEAEKATVVRRRVKVAEPAAEASPEAEKATVVRRRVKAAEPAEEASPETAKATVVRRRVKAAEPAAEAAPEAAKATVVRRRVKAAEPAAETEEKTTVVRRRVKASTPAAEEEPSAPATKVRRKVKASEE